VNAMRSAPGVADDVAAKSPSRALRHLASIMFFLLLAQYLIGMWVNLFVHIPQVHPGSTGSDYFARLLQGVPWAVQHGQLPLQVHAALGLLLVLGALVIVVLAVLSRRRAWAIASILGAIGVIGAGFNGGSFLNYGHDFSSMLMALGFAVAIGSYAVGLYIAC
jgi:hypothetical protein